VIDLTSVSNANLALVLGIEDIEPDIDDCSRCPIRACVCAECASHVRESVRRIARKRGGHKW